MKSAISIVARKAGIPAFLVCLVCQGIFCQPGNTPLSQAPLGTVVKEGVRVDFRLEHLDIVPNQAVFKEGDNVRFSFQISDTATNRPISGAFPAAWMKLDETDELEADPKACREKIQTFLSGGIFGKPDLDLNAYYVLALNEDPTITVVDPLFGYGGSKLLALLQLHSRGKDWVLSKDKSRIFVSCPEAREIAVIETATWKISKFIASKFPPDRMVLQPDGHYLWVAYQEGPEGTVQHSGVLVVDPISLNTVANIPTGSGAHDIIIDDDNRRVFVSNYQQGSVSVINVGTLKKTGDILTDNGPGFMAWSTASQALYVTHQEAGTISCIDVEKMAVRHSMSAAVGVSRIRFAPGGRLGFAVNPKNDYLYIIDAASNRIIQRGVMESMPDQVVFSDELAYIRHRGSGTVLMVPLAAVGVEGKQIPVVDFPGGDNPPGKTPYPPLADGITPVPGGNSMIIANPLDESIYYYKEGMAAPMGNFSNYGHRPVAALVVDRSLKETSPGHYETIARLGAPGKYCLAFYSNAPKLGHCFELAVAGDGNIELARTIARQGSLKTTPLFTERYATVGKDFMVRFALHPHDKAEPVIGLKDVQLLFLTNSGQWNKRVYLSENEKVPGVYEAAIQFPMAGIYFLYVSSVSQGLDFNNTQYILMEVLKDAK
jgi:YVTN family beta-propeller protein